MFTLRIECCPSCNWFKILATSPPFLFIFFFFRSLFQWIDFYFLCRRRDEIMIFWSEQHSTWNTLKFHFRYCFSLVTNSVSLHKYQLWCYEQWKHSAIKSRKRKTKHEILLSWSIFVFCFWLMISSKLFGCSFLLSLQFDFYLTLACIACTHSRIHIHSFSQSDSVCNELCV